MRHVCWLLAWISFAPFVFVNRTLAVTLSDAGAAKDAGPAAVQNWGTDGFDLYGVVDPATGFGESGNNGQPRVLAPPAYIATITLQATNTYSGSPSYSQVNFPVAVPRRIGLLDNVQSESSGGLGAERSLLSFTIADGAPASFVVGVIIDGSAALFDYPDLLRLRSVASSASQSIAPDESVANNNLLDVYFFRVNGATSGETLQLLGTESDHKDNGLNNVAISGLVFPGRVPEPSCTFGVAILYLSCMRRRKILS